MRNATQVQIQFYDSGLQLLYIPINSLKDSKTEHTLMIQQKQILHKYHGYSFIF